MKLKKLVSAGLVAVMATSLLAGCGGSKDSSETADGKKNLSIFIFANDHESTVYKSMIDQYKKDHADTIGNIDVQITTQDEYSKTLTGMMTAGDLPDIFYVGPESVEQFVENGYIEDLQPILDKKGISTDGMLAQEALDSYRYDGDKTGSGDLYALPKEYYEKYGVRRYGFHGTSHSFVSKRLAELAGLDYNNSKMIICHIGSGASISAIKNGKSIDTSMGMTPLEGLVMGTRSGDIDPAIVEFICQKENISVSEMTTILNKKSGVLGLSGVSNDFRDLVDARESGNKDAANALDVLVYRIVKYIGAYYMALGGVDAIALTAGAGENNKEVREMIMEGISVLGVKINQEANQTRGEEILLSTKDSKVPVWIVPTNEELAIARETARLVK